MFKSVFVKFISAFMLINIISILISTSVISVMMNDYGEKKQLQTVSKIAYSVTEFIVKDYNDSGDLEYNDYIEDSIRDIKPVLDLMSINIDDLVIFLTDENGNVVFAGGSDNAGQYADASGRVENYDKKLPDEIMTEIAAGNSVTGTDNLDGFFDSDYVSYILPITSKDGEVVGTVITCTVNDTFDDLLETMKKSIVMSNLWLMLAALVAIYFISERFVSPLREMSRAAKEFAKGHFDVRVSVIGNDEVSELAEAFNNMANTLQHSEETKQIFLSNVSHDLRTPMTTISGFIDSILAGAIPPEQYPHYLGIIASEVRRLSRLVTTLLDITRIQAGERKFNMAPYDICEQAREILISSEQRIEDKKLNVIFDCDNDNMYVNADKDAIHQILYNICDNAIKFSNEGGEYRIDIHEIAGNKISVSVYNEGIGISKEDLPYVFDRFYKSDKSRGLDKTGVGLGLYIARTIIEAHNQTIKVESEYGKWCKFTFTLTKAQGTGRTRAASANADKSDAQKNKNN